MIRVVVEIRAFLNSDVPRLADLWNRQEAVAGRLQVVTAALLETHVFSKSYFDPAGLLLAEMDQLLVGATFCGFAPNDGGSKLDSRLGILSHSILDISATDSAWRMLWKAANDYFKHHGTEWIFFGSRFPDCPYLTGLCGGTFVPGMVTTDRALANRLNEVGFKACGEVDVLTLDVQRFKPPVDRRVIMAKRSYDVRVAIDPLPDTWWQNSISAFRHQIDFRMVERKSNRVCGYLSFCNTRPIDSGWDSRYFGIAQIQVDDALQRSGLGQAMLFDAIKDLGQRGVVEIEAQVPRANTACLAMLKKIGFRLSYSASQMHKFLGE